MHIPLTSGSFKGFSDKRIEKPYLVSMVAGPQNVIAVILIYFTVQKQIQAIVKIRAQLFQRKY